MRKHLALKCRANYRARTCRASFRLRMEWALTLLDEGVTYERAAAIVGVAERSVYRWANGK